MICDVNVSKMMDGLGFVLLLSSYKIQDGGDLFSDQRCGYFFIDWKRSERKQTDVT